MGYIKELRHFVGNRPLIMVGACVIVEQHQAILLQKRTDNGYWGFPGGALEPGESLEQVARRELFEETGLIAGDLELLEIFSGEGLYYQYPNGDQVHNVIAAYRCTDVQGEPVADGEEGSGLHYFDLHELPPESQWNPADRPALQSYLKKIAST